MTVEQFLHDTAHHLRIDMAINMDHPARYSRVYSSSTGSIFRLQPRTVLSWIKSQLKTCSGCLAFVGSPVETPRRRPLGWRGGIRQAQFTSQTLHETFTHLPAFVLQQFRDLGIAPPRVWP